MGDLTQRRNFPTGATLYERKPNPDAQEPGQKPYRLDRVTFLDRQTKVRDLMSPRLQIPAGLRSVGNLYGASAEMCLLGTHTPFAQAKVDGGHGPAGGTQVALIEAAQVVRIAQEAMRSMKPIRYAHRSKGKAGGHRPISPRHLVDSVCFEGMAITEVAMRAGWWIETGKRAHAHVPDKQSKRIKAGLVDTLREIDAAWGQRGIDARGIIGVVEVRG